MTGRGQNTHWLPLFSLPLNHFTPTPSPALVDESEKMVMSTPTGPPEFRVEKDLENYLENHLSLPGQDLLIIGRQVKTVGGRVDLLAIDSAGVIYIIELKLNVASPSAIGQVLGYLCSIKGLNRETFIRLVADGDLRIDLVESFQRHFGHPLPETVNESQVLVIIAASIDPATANVILELLEGGYSGTVKTFRYVRRLDAVSLIPWCRNDQDVDEGLHAGATLSVPPNRIDAPRKTLVNYPVNENCRRFWLTHAHDFGPFVTFGFIFERYEDWVGAQPASGVHLRNKGSVGRQVCAIIAESNEWTRVWVAHRSDMAAYDTFKAPPSVRTYCTQDHRVVSYQRNPVGRA